MAEPSSLTVTILESFDCLLLEAAKTIPCTGVKVPPFAVVLPDLMIFMSTVFSYILIKTGMPWLVPSFLEIAMN
jgi:hypothetical protein